MDDRGLGRAGMQVSPLCLGTMMFGAWGERDHATSIEIIHRALDAGINFIDTADVYSQDESEVIVGKALAGGRGDDVVLATKFHGGIDTPEGTWGASVPGGDPNRRGNARRWIVRELESSLQHRLDRPLPSGSTGRGHRPRGDALCPYGSATRREDPRLRSSTFPAHELVEAQWVSERRGLGRYVTEQPPYSLLSRGIEADVLPVAERYGLGVLPWSPLAGGWLTGRYRKGREAPSSPRRERMPGLYDLSTPENRRKLEAADALALLAEEAGVALIHLALAFVLQHPAVTAPSPGRGRWSSWRASSAPSISPCRPTCSIASTRSCRPA